MAKHKLYCQFENTSPLTSNEMVKNKCADKNVRKEKSANDERVTNEKTNFTISDPLSGGDCASDSDSNDFFDTFTRPGPKLPYSAKEDEWILKYVLKGQNVFKVGSLSLWKHLESKKENPKRTYHSLKNRFLRSIRPHIFTRYRHLITSDTEIERILAKFPELKCKVGRTNTLSRIKLPARKPSSKSAEGGLVNGSRGIDERVASPRTFTCNGPPNGSARREPTLNVHDFSNFERKVTVVDKSVAVSVNFSSKEQLRKPVSPSIGIYETYMKFKKKNKLVLCSGCGRYNQPRKNKLADSSGDRESLNFSAGRDVLIGSSLGADPGKSSVTNSGSPSAKNRKVGDSQPRPCGLFSPSVVEDASEEHDALVGWGTPDEPPEANEVGQAPEMPTSVALRQEADSAAADRLSEMDDDLDSTYEDTVTDFKKLIKNEEERMLVRKCLFGKGGVLGLSDSISQMSMESYFVELSPNLETPELTIDYSSLSPSQKSVRENSSQSPIHNSERDKSIQSPTRNSERDNSGSLLARNMLKMLEESKTSKES